MDVEQREWCIQSGTHVDVEVCVLEEAIIRRCWL